MAHQSPQEPGDPSAVGGAPGVPARRLDASMSLLLDAMRHPLDPGYALAAARRDRRGVRSVAVTAVLALAGGLLLATAAVQLRPRGTEGVRDRARLQAEIDDRVRRADAMQAANERLRAEIAREQQQALQGGQAAGLASRVQLLGLLTGELAVRGPGLRYTIMDAASVNDTGQVKSMRSRSGQSSSRC